MTLIDVNVLVHAYRGDAPDHSSYRKWLDTLLRLGFSFGISNEVFAGFLRVVTHPKVFRTASPLPSALEFCKILRGHPSFIPVSAGPTHWGVFVDLCQNHDLKGNLIHDAHHAALAIELDADWVSADADFARFKALRWVHPLKS